MTDGKAFRVVVNSFPWINVSSTKLKCFTQKKTPLAKVSTHKINWNASSIKIRGRTRRPLAASTINQFDAFMYKKEKRPCKVVYLFPNYIRRNLKIQYFNKNFAKELKFHVSSHPIGAKNGGQAAKTRWREKRLHLGFN